MLDRWLERLISSAEANPGAIAIAHSLGCILIAHAAMRMPGIKIAGALLVAPADVDANIEAFPQLRNFAPMPTTTLPFPSIVVASSNDPFMSQPRARELAANWGADFVDMGDAGHINIASGYGWWPAAHRMIDTLDAIAGIDHRPPRRIKHRALGKRMPVS